MWNGQHCKGFTYKNTPIEGKFYNRNGKTFILMEDNKKIDISRLRECKPIGRLIEEEVSKAIDGVLIQDKYDWEKINTDPQKDKVIQAFTDAVSHVTPEVKQNEENAKQQIENKINLFAQAEKTGADPAEQAKAQEDIQKITSQFEKTNETTKRDFSKKLEEYNKIKHDKIKTNIRERSELTDGLFDDEELFDEINNYENSIAFEDNDPENIVSDIEAAEFLDTSKGHGYAPEDYEQAYEIAKEMIKNNDSEEQIVAFITKHFEVSSDEARDTYLDAVTDEELDKGSYDFLPSEINTEQFDNEIDDTIEDLIDDYEEKADIYSDEALWEHICTNLNIDGKNILNESKDIPEAVLKLSEIIKQNNLREQWLSQRKEQVKQILRKYKINENTDINKNEKCVNTIKQLFEYDTYISKICNTRKDIRKLYEDFKPAQNYAKIVELGLGL
jgi:hypothetical protein